ncbi:MAG TPA: ATP-dependent RNA helicase HrpA [Mycobacteriales bacterium]|nr:ATP-dependent RNA helicase HrpA [Mycobacteriales bacterium]
MEQAAVSPEDLRRRLPELMLRDERRLRSRLRARDLDLARVAGEVELAEQRIARRRAAVPRLTYPEQLPVSQRREDLLEALSSAQVVVVAGETGSGKTTQLPKLLLELGRGVRGAIGHTQPRRIAARTVAERIAEELDVPLGSAVGYKVRFTDRSSDSTLVKLMTDGVLLAELQRDRDLLAYDTVVVDEAHERSLNIDFLLGYLAQLLPRRPDLKVVITSATIETERFSQHFGGAPVVEVTGRTYPVEVRYRPLVRETAEQEDGDDEEPRDAVTAICDAVTELQAEGPGDVLVFLSGEREIRDAADALSGCVRDGTEVLPLYGRLSAAEQHRVFTPSRGNRVVLATNVAETSLTVPGIRYVVDPGTARISRYSLRTKVQRLPIEAISQASADQRKGRCGRVAAGICIRLYSEDDFLGRPEFTDPEILRTNLASVLLQMAALGLGDIEAFPFVDPPDRRQVRDGVDLLHELGALEPHAADPGTRLTSIGRRLARLPVDPRLGRMVLEADRNGCVHEVLVLAAALSIQDPRERPTEKRQAADEKHARFRDEHSDFMAWLNLWRYLQDKQDELSSSAFRRLCRREFLNYLRVREWQDLYAQLRSAVRDLDLAVDDKGEPDAVRVHRSLLAGLLSHLGVRDEEKKDYLGARGARFVVFPGSPLAKKPPRWLMAAELVETSRLFGRTVARIDPQWVEPLAQHLVKRQYSEPHWSKKRAGVVAVERVTLYGVPIVVGRTVDYGRIDPELSRELFLRHGVVEGDWDTHHSFLAANRTLLEQVEGLEDRLRRRDLVVDDEALFAFYDARVPSDVVSGRHFDAWWKKARHETPDLLTLTVGDLVREDAAGISALDFPDVWVQGEVQLDLHYVFEPGSPEDGVTVDVPVGLLNRVDAEELSWQVPGLRHELVTELLRGLPKQVRRQLGPAPDRAAALLAVVRPREEPLLDALSRAIRSTTGVVVDHTDWDLSRVPAHLRMTARVHDDRGRVLAEGKDLDELRRRLAPRVQKALSTAATGIERTGLSDWTVGTLPRTVELGAVRGHPALVDEGSAVGVRVLADPSAQSAAHALGTRRLLLLQTPSPLKAVVGRMPNRTKLALAQSPYPSVPALLEDCVAAAVDALVAEAGGPPWDAEAWTRLHDAVRPRLERSVEQLVATVGTVLAAAADVRGRIAPLSHPLLQDAVTDIRAQVDGLVAPGFVSRTGARRLTDVQRYLQAAQRRLERLPDDVERDRRALRQVQQLERELAELVTGLPPARRAAPEVTEVRWMLQELRVSLFAPPMRTAYSVSEKRVLRAMDALLG